MAGASEALYVDAKRTHEVRVCLERGGTIDFVVRESAYGARNAIETYVERRSVKEPWETTMLQMRLETRLALLGAYHRATPGGWTPVRPAQAGAPIDLAPLELGDEPGIVDFHHFTADARTATLVAVHQGDGAARRTLLARVDDASPDGAQGKLEIIHTSLPTPLSRSALASQHLELRELRYAKLPRDAPKLLAPPAWSALRATLDGILGRLADTPAAKTSVFDGLKATSRADPRVLAQLAESRRRSAGAANAARTYDVDFEIDPAAGPVAAKKPTIRMEEVGTDVLQALQHPKLAALPRILLAPGDDARLIDAGERAIHLAMRRLRDARRADEQHLVSLLEASLLLRYALAKRARVDPEIITRVKHAAAYF